VNSKAFKAFKAEFDIDVRATAKAMNDFVGKWKLKEKEVATLTPEQNEEMEELAESTIGKAMEEM
jgi:hypothetical protein